MSSVFCFCRGNEQCEQSRQSTMGSLLTNRRIDLTVHSATARMSEGKAGANGALRVECSTLLKLYVELRASQGNWLLGRFTSSFTWGGSAQARVTGFLGGLPQALPRKLRANSGTSRTHLHTATGAAFPAGACTPINRQSPRRARQ